MAVWLVRAGKRGEREDLGYRDQGRRPGQPLTLPEALHLRSMIQRIAALLVLQPELDSLYERCVDGPSPQKNSAYPEAIGGRPGWYLLPLSDGDVGVPSTTICWFAIFALSM